jgi:hypothetical protein
VDLGPAMYEWDLRLANEDGSNDHLR